LFKERHTLTDEKQLFPSSKRSIITLEEQSQWNQSGTNIYGTMSSFFVCSSLCSLQLLREKNDQITLHCFSVHRHTWSILLCSGQQWAYIFTLEHFY